MLKKILAIIFLVLALAYIGTAQWKDDFAGTGAVVNNDRYGWKSPTGTAVASTGSIEIDGSGNAMPYHASGPINYGYVYKDSLLTSSFEGYVIFQQKGGTDNVRYFAVGASTSTDFTAASGYFGGMQEMTTSGGVDRYNLKRMAYQMPNLGGQNPSDFTETRYISKEFAAGDTFGITVWMPSNVFTIWTASVGGSRDTLSTSANQHNFSAGTYFWIGGAELTTPFKITEAGIRNPAGGGSPPPGTEINPPDAILSLSQLSAYVGDAIAATVTASDDSALNATTVEADSTVGGYHTITTNSYAGTSTTGSFTSATFTRYTPGTITVRARTSDKAGKLDTTATQTVTFSNRPTITTSRKKVFGWLTFTSTQWPAPYSGGTIPHDSIPWSVLTHASLFAANGANPPQQSYITQYPYLFARAHQAGVDAGICVGGSGDAALVTLMNTPTAWTSWINTYLSYLDNGASPGGDFIDFDLEGTYNVANVASFFAQLKDSLDTRQSGNDPTRPPYIVLTVGGARARAWVSLEPYVEFVNMMTYDYAQSGTWGRLVWDCAVTSRQYFDGTGTITDYYAPAGATNAEAPTMQKFATWATEAGWPAEKVVVGFDVWAAYYTGTSASGRGPTYIRQPENTLTSVSAVAASPFTTNWPTINAIPADSIKFDPVSNAYWAHTGTSQTNDRVWTMTTLPGRDSGMIAVRKLVDSMNIGGVALWELGTQYWSTTPVPTGGRGWWFSQMKQHLNFSDSIITTCNPPSSFTPANGATNVALPVTLDWPDIACAAASQGYLVQVDDINTFASPFKDTLVTPSQVSLSGYLVNGQTYYARVSVKDATTGQFSAWSSTSFTVVAAAPGAPTILNPLNGSTLTGTTAVVLWIPSTNGPTGVPGASNFYEVHASLSNTFATTFKRDSLPLPGTNASYTLTGMANSTPYYLRMRSKTAGGYSPWSATVSFTTGAAKPLPPILSSPTNNEGNTDTALYLRWTHATNYWYYLWEIDDAVTFTSLTSSGSTSSNQAYLSGLTSNTTYYWRVRTVGSVDTSVWSEVYSFTTSQSAPPPPPRSTVQMGYWYDINKGDWIWNRPAPWIIYGFTRSDMSDVPTPDSGVIAWSVYGIKTIDTTLFYSFGNSSVGGGITMEALRDSFELSYHRGSFKFLEPIIERSLYFQSSDTTDGRRYYTGFLPYTGQRYVDIDWPLNSGRMAIASGDNLTPATVEITGTPLGPKSGGLGFKPTDARDAGTGAFFWGFSPSDTNYWTIYTVSGLRTGVGILTSQNIIGPKLAYLDANEQWQFLDTNYYRDAGGSGANLGDLLMDSAKASLRFMDSSAQFYRTGTYRGALGVGSSDILSLSVPANTEGRLSDGLTSDFLSWGTTSNDGFFMQLGTGDGASDANNRFEIQYRGFVGTENDSLFQVTDSAGQRAGVAAVQLSNKGKVSANSYRTLDTTMAQLTGNANDYYVGLRGVVRLSSDASRNITGFTSRLDNTNQNGRWLTIINVGAQNIVIQNQNVGSTTTNRIITGTGADVTLAGDATLTLWYDGTTQRWRVIN